MAPECTKQVRTSECHAFPTARLRQARWEYNGLRDGRFDFQQLRLVSCRGWVLPASEPEQAPDTLYLDLLLVLFLSFLNAPSGSTDQRCMFGGSPVNPHGYRRIRQG
jgi:hypothetical protein